MQIVRHFSTETWLVFLNLLIAIGSLITTYLVKQIRHFQRRFHDALDHSGQSIEISHRMDIEINVIIQRALDEFGAMRAYLSQYKNGERFLSGEAVWKKTRTHERVRDGAVREQLYDFQDVLCSTMAEEMKLVIEAGPGWAVVSQIPNCKFRRLCERGGCAAVARAEVRSRDGRLWGFIGLDFDFLTTETGERIEPHKPGNLSKLTDLGTRIGEILSDMSDPPPQSVEHHQHKRQLAESVMFRVVKQRIQRWKPGNFIPPPFPPIRLA